MKLLSRIKNTIFDVRFTPVILLVLCLISYGIFIPVTGFFIDDWYFMWFKHFFGALQFPAYYAVDRPFQGLFYPVASFLTLGSESPVVWGLFAIILRWMSTLALWGMLKTLWPKADRQNCLVVLLAAVFPGFTQHWFVIQYSYYYACLAFFFLSITFMLKSIREPKKFWIYYPISVLLGFYSMTSEFFFGLELIRPIVLFIEFQRMDLALGKRILSILKYWSAFFIYFIGFAIWRIFFYVSVGHKLEIAGTIATNPVGTLLSKLRDLYQGIVNAVINSWANPFISSNYPEEGAASILIPVIMSLVFISLLIWLILSRTWSDPAKNDKNSNWRVEALILSISALIFAGIPFLAAGLKIDYLGFNNRFMLAFIIGSCLLVVVIFDYFCGWTKKDLVFIPIALLVAVALGYQVSVAKVYKNVWLKQTQLFWQLNWRIPGLKPGTTLFTFGFPSNSDLYSGNAFSAELNWTYSDRVVNRQVDYQFIVLDSGQSLLVKSLEENIPININFRTYVFKGNTSQSIYINPPLQGCLRILDQNFTPPETVIIDLLDNPSQKEILRGSDLSDLNLILKDGVTPNHPPLQILGHEATHTWCYYFEKAELARQYGDYEQVVSLLDEATAKGYSPSVDTEWYPFVDAYARSGDWQNAQQITKRLAVNSDPTVNLGLCHLWQNLAKDFTDPVNSKISDEMITSVLYCGN